MRRMEDEKAMTTPCTCDLKAKKSNRNKRMGCPMNCLFWFTTLSYQTGRVKQDQVCQSEQHI